MTDDRERQESWVVTENTQEYTPDNDPESNEAWVQTENTQEVSQDDE